MNGLRFWYLKHFNPEKALAELRRPAEGDYVVVHDGPHMWTRVKAEELDEYMHYLKDKGEFCLETYRKYAEGQMRKADLHAPDAMRFPAISSLGQEKSAVA